jgi:hypothetical protein
MFLDIVHWPLSENTVLIIFQNTLFRRLDCLLFWKINRTVFLDKARTMDNAQKHNICTNVPSSQTFRSYLKFIVFAAQQLWGLGEGKWKKRSEQRLRSSLRVKQQVIYREVQGGVLSWSWWWAVLGSPPSPEIQRSFCHFTSCTLYRVINYCNTETHK